ncbi:MAG: ABC transporter permease [Gammaproteobacteria bacterium]|nr:ABC transporter permease [Gammaproteobacteria bacterium]NIR81887.1 ABC transporter permease [Gammaproteobacteria bacterium]NIR88719.1 ABC transporter permease [Gammaproteobacteria bacterium]NIU02995.1 ABC transporter permease [Gammaproteobacteria bacterium]NIV50516.1 ABC transporter permease [Gammaproteobacteria bacterium]
MAAAPMVVAHYTLLEALRNRLLWLVVAFMVVSFGLSRFIAEVAITETVQVESAVFGASLRLFAVFIVSLFVISSMVRELNDKGVELVLSMPVARASYFFGKLLGFWSLALLIVLACCLSLMVYAPVTQTLLWGLSLLCELLIVTAFSILCLFTFSQVTLALSAVLGFYVLSRTIGAIQLIGQGRLVAGDSLSQRFIEWLLGGIAFVLPELDRFTLSDWLVYHTGDWGTLVPIAGQTLVYLALLLGAALFDLYRKNF